MRAGERALNGGAARPIVSSPALRRTNARAGAWIAVAPLLIIAGVLAALAQIPWLLGMAAPAPRPDISAAQLGLLDLSGDPTTGGPSYVARLRDLGTDPARLVKERGAGSYEHARTHRLAPCRRAPLQSDRWLANELATSCHAGWSTVIDGAIAFEAVNRSSAAERRNDARHTSLEGDIHSPRGPPANPSA